MPLANVFLSLVFAVNLTSVFGYLAFTCHPELLARWDWAASIFGYSYTLFARLQIVLSFLAMVFALKHWSRWAWVPAFLAVCIISATSELMGTTYGLPFGSYEYTALLGPKMFSRVPYLIPVSWFFMSVASFALADSLAPILWFRVLGGSILLSAWDLTLDPAMSRLSPFWVWAQPGRYFGTPLTNLFGWFLTGMAIMASLELLRSSRWIRKTPYRFFQLFYIANLSLPLGLVIGAGLWQPVALTSFTLAALYVWGTWWVDIPREA